MRLVERAAVRPSHCVVFPHLGGSHPEGYVDTGNEIGGIDPHAYISVVAVREMARLIGFVSGEEHAQVLERAAELAERVLGLEEEIAQADAALEAIDVMESRGFTARRKPGRPRKAEEVAA